MKPIGRYFLLLPLLLSATLWGHKVVESNIVHDSFEKALFLDQPDVSQIAYHIFSEQSAQFWMCFETIPGEPIDLVLSVPVLSELKDFKPVAWLLSPSFPTDLSPTPGVSLSSLFPDLPSHWGIQSFVTRGNPVEFFHEPFSNTDSWFLLRLSFTPVQQEIVYVVVTPEPGKPVEGRVGLAIGKKEKFGLRDILALGRWIKIIREFHAP